MPNDCLFCRIIRGEIPQKVYEDDQTVAFDDIHPQAPTHVLVIPKKHVVGLKEATAEDADLIGHCHLTAAKIAKQRGIENGYRTVLNVGAGAGQSVFHLHVHLLGGRSLSWPRDSVPVGHDRALRQKRVTLSGYKQSIRSNSLTRLRGSFKGVRQ